MRVRLLLDAIMDDSEINRLAELIAEQPALTLDYDGRVIGARLVGAQQVPEGEST